MNSQYGLTPENLLRALPEVLQRDENMQALAEAVVSAIEPVLAETDMPRIYAQIDELDETLLDILAYDFKVDWWDYDYTIEQKRQTLKDSWMVHKHLGTPWAVETAISAFYPNTKVSQWFDYDGKPYTFRLHIDVSNRIIDTERQTRVLDLVNFYKNLRSRLEQVEYTATANKPATLFIGGCIGSVVTLGLPVIPDSFDFTDTLYIGGRIAAAPVIGIPEQVDTFDFIDTLQIGGRVDSMASVVLPEKPDTLIFKETGYVNGQMATITTISMPEQSQGR